MRIEATRRKRGTRDAEATRAAILDAARAEFAESGLGGGRIEAIAERAACNKAMLYHYFGSKDALFTAVLEHNYALIRAAEAELDLARLDPLDAIRRFVEFSFDYVATNPEFIKLLNEENLHRGRHIDPDLARQLNSPVVSALSEVLARGTDSGVFRSDVDPAAPLHHHRLDLLFPRVQPLHAFRDLQASIRWRHAGGSATAGD